MTNQIKRGVSLYSYQEEFFLGTMTLEDQIATSASFGALGIEVVPHQTFASFPHLSDREIDHWHELHERYGTTPTAFDSFTDARKRPDRRLTEDELFNDLLRDLKLSQRLGCNIVRIQMNTPLSLIERAVPYAVDYGQRLAVEIHAPLHYEHRWTKRFIDLIDKVDSGHLGLMGDFSTFTRKFSRVVYDWALNIGASPKFLDYVVEAYEGPEPRNLDFLGAELGYLGASELETQLAGLTGFMTWSEPEKLVPHLPYIFHFQAKFWEMVDDSHEYGIPYADVIKVLQENEWSGYLSSEYEGNRFIQDRIEVDSVEQVRRQHAMFATLLDQPQESGATHVR